MFKWPDKFFSMLIDLLLDAFPQIKNFRSSYYQAKKMIMDLGLGYEKIHICPNNCRLYWGEMVEKDCCLNVPLQDGRVKMTRVKFL